VSLSNAGSANLIQANRIGLGADGISPLGNSGSGIDISDTSETIVRANEIAFANQGISVAFGSRNVLDANVVHDQGIDGIVVSEGDRNEITGNAIYSNSRHGVLLFGAANTLIAGNLIHHNSGAGIFVNAFTQFATSETGNTFSQNAIYDNSQFGIDLGGDGVTANDLDDADTGPNDNQNFPTILDVTALETELHLRVSLQSSPHQMYRIEFFASADADPSGFGQGQAYFGAKDVMTDEFGYAEAIYIQPGFLPFGNLSATATDFFTGSTSEFGPSFAYFTSGGPDPLIVTTTDDTIADDGVTSLREAILYANANPGHDTITFNILPQVRRQRPSRFA
jgi:CSLREA domain-containing protein